MKPIIKWTGGKSQLTEQIRKLIPDTYTKYYEPFVGGGAVLLDLCPEEAVVNDLNSELINMYLQIKFDVEGVINYLSILDAEHEAVKDPKAFYYRIRKDFNDSRDACTATQAARFIYLNKHCFNGLFRVNKKGEFNVPFNGKLTGSSFDPEHLRAVSKQLQNVQFMCGDFSWVVTAEEGSLVYLDPPYDPDEAISTEGFVGYQKNGWTREDTKRLKSICDDLVQRNCKVIISNNDTAFIRELFKDYKIIEVDVRRSINRDGNKRTGKEVIITNY